LHANAWIFSGGFNCGVIRLIGDAAAENITNNDIKLIGFCMWGCLSDREKLEVVLFNYKRFFLKFKCKFLEIYKNKAHSLSNKTRTWFA
jgi:hypothetical protein